MEEEKKQQEGFAKKAGDQLKKGAKNQAKKAVKEVFKKIIKALAPILLKLLIILIIAIIVLEAISWVIDLFTSSESKNASANAIQYSYSSSVSGEDGEDGTENEADGKSKIIIDTENIEDGAYKLKYKYYDEDENEISEDEALEKLKEQFDEEEIEYNNFNDSELRILAVLACNGLPIDCYTEEELKALVIFLKADMAGNNFDLRPADDIGKKITIDDIKDSDVIYGTLQVHKTNVVKNDKGVAVEDEQPLEFVPYGDEETEGTFAYMVKQNDLEVVNKFSINGDGNLVAANSWRKSGIEVHYFDGDGNSLEEEAVPEDIRLQPNGTVRVNTKEIDYKKIINGYSVKYNVLVDLLLTTENVDFCLDLATLGFNSKIVFNIRETLSVSDTTTTTDYTQTTLLYDRINYTVSGQIPSETKWETIYSGPGTPESVASSYGWTPSSGGLVGSGSNGATYSYSWTNNGIAYYLSYSSTSRGNYCVLNRQITEYTSGQKISKSDYLIVNGHEATEINYEDYTAKEIEKYKVEINTHTENARCQCEISEIDCWFLKYNTKDKYEDPTIEVKKPESTYEFKGEYPEEATLVIETSDSSEIEGDAHVEAFVEAQEDKYEEENPKAKDIECVVTHLTVSEKTKLDSIDESNTINTKYKFGEEIPDTTQISLKNIEYINGTAKYTAENEEGEEEIGFLRIYDSYISDGEDLFLQDDAEKKFFELLEHSSDGKYAEMIKGLLFAYDGIDRGVTNLEELLTMFKVKKISFGSETDMVEYIFNYINQYEGATPIEGEYYVAVDIGDGCVTIGHGMTNWVSELSDLKVGQKRLIDEVDELERDLIRTNLDMAEAVLAEYNLSANQLVAVCSVAHNTGSDDIISFYQWLSSEHNCDGNGMCWEQEKDNKVGQKISNLEEQIAWVERTRYSPSETNLNKLRELVEIAAKDGTDSSARLYTNHLSKYIHVGSEVWGGLVWRRWGEFLMFQYGYNVHDGTYFIGAGNELQQKIVEVALNSAEYGIVPKSGFCYGWVGDVYAVAGAPCGGGCGHCAKCGGYFYSVSDDFDNIPLGAAVYGYSGSQFGHVGIYVGNGEVAHNIGYVAIWSLEDWCNTYSPNAWGWMSTTDSIVPGLDAAPAGTFITEGCGKCH